jgi:tetratricopeptide (TPR) repeat protein
VSSVKCHASRPPFPSLYFLLHLTLVVALFLLTTPSTLAQSPPNLTEAMLAANQNYEGGQYERAIDAYEDLIAAGIRDSDVYYNLGNAYFKQGDIGRAILNYRRAQYLDPIDPDVMTNLRIARAQTLDQLEADSGGALINLIELAEEWLTLNQAAILALLLWVLICGFLLLAIFVRRLRNLSAFAMAVLGVFLVIGLISMANRLYKENQFPPAVIIAEEVDVTSGPGGSDQYLVEFDLHAGAEVLLVERRPGWRRISLPGNLQGWVPQDAVEPVIQ